jgi:hypothetical protein
MKVLFPAEVLRELGYEDERVDELREKGIV